ncbi:PepSY-like domain-containing protein [Flavobacterium sp.]
MKATKILTAALLFLAVTVSAQKKIEISELPAPALAFLKEHFPKQSIEVAKKDREDGEKGYEVILSDKTEVEFWADGKWREVDGDDKPIPTAYIDKSIVDYVAKNYPNSKITHIDYGHKDVDVDLDGKIDLEFSKEGKFLKAD